jgi:hypothetical protein
LIQLPGFRQNLDLREGDFAVKQKRFTVKIVAVLKQAEAGVPLAELLRRLEQT